MSNAATRTYHVRATWDPEAEIWVAESDDVIGLVAGAETVEGLIDKLRVLIPELLELNGQIATDGPDVPIEILAARSETIRRTA